MTEVIIDGVKYIPAKDAIANTLDIAKGLLMECMGVCDDKEAEEYISVDSGVIYVLVNDWGEGVQLSEIINNIAEVVKDE